MRSARLSISGQRPSPAETRRHTWTRFGIHQGWSSVSRMENGEGSTHIESGLRPLSYPPETPLTIVTFRLLRLAIRAPSLLTRDLLPALRPRPARLRPYSAGLRSS